MMDIGLNKIFDSLNSVFGARLNDELIHLYSLMSRVKDKVENRDINDIFVDIYKNNTWGSEESRSGPSSTLSNTNKIREELVKIIDDYGIKTFLDAPCGDMNWMKEVPLTVQKYYGADIVPEMIEKNNASYRNVQREFLVLDITRDHVPSVDLIMCRECLQHLSIKAASAALSNFKESGSRYLLATTFPHTNLNHDSGRGGFYPYNLCLAPFNLATPMLLFEDYDYGSRPHMALWRIDNDRQWPIMKRQVEP